MQENNQNSVFWLIEKARRFFSQLGLYEVLIGTVILYKFLLLVFFASVHTDDDQTLLWAGSVDFSHGSFHEPRFYGQSYGTMLEALLAVPFLWLQIPVIWAVPLVTIFLSTAPFLLFGHLLKKSGHTTLAQIVVFIALAMPVSFDILTSMPRSFIPGICVSMVGAYFALTWTERPWRIVVSGLLLSLGYGMNSNAIMISGLVILRELLDVQQNQRKVALMIFGLAGGLGINWLIDSFYVANPSYVLHQFNNSVSFDSMVQRLPASGKIYVETTPQLMDGTFYFLLSFLGIVVSSVKKRWATSVLWLVFAVGLVYTLGNSKLAEAADSIYFSRSRLLLPIPYALVYLVSVTCTDYPWSKKVHSYIAVSVIVLLLPAMLGKYVDYKSKQDYYTKSNWGVSAVETNLVVDKAKTIIQEAKAKGLKWIVFEDGPDSKLYTYATSAIGNGELITYSSVYDRRTWLWAAAKEQTGPFLYVSDVAKEQTHFDVLHTGNLSIVEWLQKFTGADRVPMGQMQEEMLSSLKDYRYRIEVENESLVTDNENFTLEIALTNGGSERWGSKTRGANALAISHRVSNEVHSWLGTAEGFSSRAYLWHDVEPGESIHIYLPITHLVKGKNSVEISMVQELVAWFHDRGQPPLTVDITRN